MIQHKVLRDNFGMRVVDKQGRPETPLLVVTPPVMLLPKSARNINNIEHFVKKILALNGGGLK